jgi:hypothetical protein
MAEKSYIRKFSLVAM